MLKFDKSKERWFWPALAITAATFAVRGVFTLSKVFYVRDLANYFWPYHLWLRRTISAGHIPLWNPESGLGFAAIADPSLQLFFLPTLPFRLLLPEAVGFNVMIAFPVLLAAAGMYLFARGYASRQSSALGAIVFAVSGPLLSSTSSINPVTAAACIPWLLWSVDKLHGEFSARHLLLIAAIFALAMFAGQPDMTFWSAVLAGAYAALGTRSRAGKWRASVNTSVATVVGGSLGLLLSSVQTFPLIDATVRSSRGAGLIVDGWSVHPLSLLEALMPSVFGSMLEPSRNFSPWLTQLNNGREPYLISLYVGAIAVALGLLGAAAGQPRRWVFFWSVVFILSLIFALGYFTPIYPALRESLPLVRSFRYPAKFAILTSFALGALVAAGWDALEAMANQRTPKRRLAIPLSFVLIVATASLVVTILVTALPQAASGLFARLAVATGMSDPAEGAMTLVRSMSVAAPRLLGIAAAAALLLWIGASKRRSAKLVRTLLFAGVVVDLLLTNSGLNPTIDASALKRPSWMAAVREHPGDRIFISDASLLSPSSKDLEYVLYYPPDASPAAVHTVYRTEVPYFPTGFGLRDAVMVDLTGLRPREYARMIEMFRRSDAEGRTRFLRRAGVRYFLQPDRPPESHMLAELPDFEPTALYEGPEPAPRVSIVSMAIVEPDVEKQIGRLFAEDFDPSVEVLVDAEPLQPAGTPGAVRTASAAITGETPSLITVRAEAPDRGGYLLLLDGYDPNWRVRVDGVEAPLIRGNGLFRAVSLTPGGHTVDFEYSSLPLNAGVIVSCVTLLALVVVSVLRRRLRTEATML